MVSLRRRRTRGEALAVSPHEHFQNGLAEQFSTNARKHYPKLSGLCDNMSSYSLQESSNAN